MIDAKIEKKFVEFIKAISGPAYTIISSVSYDIDINNRTLEIYEDDDCKYSVEEITVNETGVGYYKIWATRLNAAFITPDFSEKIYTQMQKLFKKKFNPATLFVPGEPALPVSDEE